MLLFRISSCYNQLGINVHSIMAELVSLLGTLGVVSLVLLFENVGASDST